MAAPTTAARFGGVCSVCERKYGKGERIAKTHSGWAHCGCAGITAERQRILNGETYRGRKASDWRVGSSPSSSRSSRY